MVNSNVRITPSQNERGLKDRCHALLKIPPPVLLGIGWTVIASIFIIPSWFIGQQISTKTEHWIAAPIVIGILFFFMTMGALYLTMKMLPIEENCKYSILVGPEMVWAI